MGPPAELRPRGPGVRLWRHATADRDLDDDQLEALAEACRLVDLIQLLDAQADDDWRPGVARAEHPAAIEADRTRERLDATLDALRVDRRPASV